MTKKTKTELFGKHPLAKAIESTVQQWAENNYPSVNGKEINPVTRDLFKWWFSDEAHESEKFHICQRRALETIVYCYEILGIPSVAGLFEIFSSKLLEKESFKTGIDKILHPKFGVKMATGTGKTWVITALIIWQYWNRIKHADKRFSSHFMLCAPGNIVYERLLDSFLGKKSVDGKRQPMTADIRKNIFMPEDWRAEFNFKVFTKEDLQENAPVTESPFVLITNWHQLMDTTKEREETISENIGIDVKADTISLRVERFVNFLTYNGDLIVINDEAHHAHNASDSEIKRWQEAIEVLREEIQKSDDSVFAQFDFTATPFTINGKKKEFLPHVIYDYGLVEAMRAMLVKQIFIEKSNMLSGKIETLPADEIEVTGHRDEAGKSIALSKTQEHMIEVGLAKLEKLQEEFEKLKINKKPVMFVVADRNEEADLIAKYIKQKKGRNGLVYEDKQVVTIHEDRKNKLSDDDYEMLKNSVFASDDIANPVKVIVSVLMLREGFDVRNVCVLVVLRRSDSDLLTEQIIGRGIRLMFPEPEYWQDKYENYQCLEKRQKLINSYDLLFIVEHPKYNEIYTQLTDAGAIIASGSSIELSLDSKSVLVSIDEQRIAKLDLAWPTAFYYKTREDINFNYFAVSQLTPYPLPLEKIEPTTIIITDYHPDTKFKQNWELKEANFSYGEFLRNVANSVIGTGKREAWLTRYFVELTGIIDSYVSEHLFGHQIDFNDASNAARLRNQELFDFATVKVRTKLMDFIQNVEANETVEAQWIRLSNFRDIKVRIEHALKTKRCIYPFIDFAFKGGFERKFTEEYLESDAMVEAYVKLSQYPHNFSIPYRNSRGFRVPYFPDFLVKTSEFMLIVETKSEKDARNDKDVKSKAIAAEQKCREMSKLNTVPPIVQPKQWKYILLPEDIYKEMEGQSLKALIGRCESNLAMLKMSREE
ncbi:DEAD/DEAH box helicase family protein [Candidatus Woesearchaeota archaeon]|nr:DEAD/DEAH box helicase family protein [Candidatus Woesearchaeota archaeon]